MRDRRAPASGVAGTCRGRPRASPGYRASGSPFGLPLVQHRRLATRRAASRLPRPSASLVATARHRTEQFERRIAAPTGIAPKQTRRSRLRRRAHADVPGIARNQQSRPRQTACRDFRNLAQTGSLAKPPTAAPFRVLRSSGQAATGSSRHVPATSSPGEARKIMAAPHPADEKPALLDHIPHAAQA